MKDALLVLKVKSCDKEGRERHLVGRDKPVCRTGSVVLSKLKSNILECCN